MDRYYQHRFSLRQIENADVVSLVGTLRVLVDPAAIEGIDHHLAFTVDGATCGLHARNCVMVPTDGSGAHSRVELRRATLLAILAGKTTWSREIATGALVVSGDLATIDRIRAAFDVEGLRS